MWLLYVHFIQQKGSRRKQNRNIEILNYGFIKDDCSVSVSFNCAYYLWHIHTWVCTASRLLKHCTQETYYNFRVPFMAQKNCLLKSLNVLIWLTLLDGDRLGRLIFRASDHIECSARICSIVINSYSGTVDVGACCFFKPLILSRRVGMYMAY